MSRIYRKTYTRYVDAAGQRCAKDAPHARKIVEQSNMYRGRYRDADGIERDVPLSTDKTAAQAMLAAKVKSALNLEAGLRSRFDDHLAKPLKKHLADFRAVQEAEGNSKVHIDNTVRWVEEILRGGRPRKGKEKKAAPVVDRFVWWRDLSISAVMIYLGSQRNAGRGLSTLNHLIGAAKSFLNWMVTDGRAPENPLSLLEAFNADTDRRRVRRALTTEELSRLFDVTAKSNTVANDFDGPTREILYRAAAYTGLRANELASLTEGAFDFTAGTVSISAKSAKNRKTAVLPLHPDFSDRLQSWMDARRRASSTLTLKPATAKLWPGTWHHKGGGAIMLRKDLEAAGIEHTGDDGEVVDFHALRTTFVTQLARVGVSLADAQKLARHSTPLLTAKNYTRLTLHDLAGAVGKLPNAQAQAGVKTGTDDAPIDKPSVWGARLGARPAATDCDKSGQSLPETGAEKETAGTNPGCPKSLGEGELSPSVPHTLSVAGRDNRAGVNSSPTRART